MQLLVMIDQNISRRTARIRDGSLSISLNLIGLQTLRHHPIKQVTQQHGFASASSSTYKNKRWQIVLVIRTRSTQSFQNHTFRVFLLVTQFMERGCLEQCRIQNNLFSGEQLRVLLVQPKPDVLEHRIEQRVRIVFALRICASIVQPLH